jgi:hypothetical protein
MGTYRYHEIWPRRVSRYIFDRITEAFDEMVDQYPDKFMDELWMGSDEVVQGCFYLHVVEEMGFFNERLGCEVNLHEFLAARSDEQLITSFLRVWGDERLRKELQGRVNAALRPALTAPIYSWEAEAAYVLNRRYPDGIWVDFDDETFAREFMHSMDEAKEDLIHTPRARIAVS